MNKPLLDYEHWTSKEMNDRLNKLLAQANALWPYPKTDFNPPDMLCHLSMTKQI